MGDESLKAALARHAPTLMSIPGVIATGAGERAGTPCIKVYVDRRTDAVARRVPSVIDGYPVVVVESGPVRAR